ncbi:hypothetical protein KI387_032560 [Taxus chinensis]|uniref:RWP-RK domain-containing protein n=1 Tax=Taxus chinensis TaxID=29808 RepID=A0AA38F3P9_TAXCH|nr:hypothetical protein KI387_032560 [Taxus chinensis]
MEGMHYIYSEMDAASPTSLHLCGLAVYQNLLNEELIKSIHVYRGEVEDRTLSAIQREFIFCPGSYKLIGDAPIQLNVQDFMTNLQQGQEHGLWICILHYNYNALYSKCTIPDILNTARNPCLKSIKELSADLDIITRDYCQAKKCERDEGISAEGECESMDVQSSFLGIEGFWPTIPQLTTAQDVFAATADSYNSTGICGEDNPNPRQPINQFLPVHSSFDLNQVSSSTRKCSLSSEKESQGTEIKFGLSVVDSATFQSIEHNIPLDDTTIASYTNLSMLWGKSSIEELPKSMDKDENRQVHRAPTKLVSSIALKDLAKCFDMPITEASRRLKVGLTVLKRKCREFGHPSMATQENQVP